MKKHYEVIDILRGIAIILVLVGHSIIVFPIDLNTISWCGTLHDLVSSVHMPLFFSLSGFCYTFRSYSDLLRRKTPRILIPYLVFAALDFAAELVFPALVNHPKTLGDMFLCFFTGEVGWFLYTLMIIFLLFPAVIWLGRKRGGHIAAGIVLLALYLYPAWPATCCLNRITTYLLFFAAGYVIRLKLKDAESFYSMIKRKAGLPFTGVMLSLLWLGSFFLFRLIETPIVSRAAELITACTGMLFWLSVAFALKDTLHGHNLAEIGKYSLQLYLFNGYFLTISRTVLVRILGITSPLLIICGNMIVILGISYLFIRTVVARVKLFRVLTGMV